MSEPDQDKSAKEAANEVVDAIRDAASDMRVVLKERAATARVKLGEIWHEDVEIVTAKAEENEEKLAAALKRNGVILKEKATTAFIRIGDEVHENIPLFQERVKKGAEDVKEEIRVRVAEIRERQAKTPGPIGKLFRRKGSDDQAAESDKP